MIEVPSVATLTQDLIRFDTTTPPGNETECVRYLERHLEAAGVECRLEGATPERLNLVARIPGRGEAPPMLLQGHVDVVTTVNQAWTHPPFEARLVDGEIWGRGAIDMKGGVAMMVTAALQGLRQGGLPGEVILAIVVDEEAGGANGAGWLAANRPELFQGARHAIGEGGGFLWELGGRRYYPIMVAEKRGSPVRAVFRGSGGHASRPHRGGSMAKLGRALMALDTQRLPVHLTTATRMMLEAMRDSLEGPPKDQVAALLDPTRCDQTLDQMGVDAAHFESILHNNVNATIVAGGIKINVIPSEVALDLDCRLLPGQMSSELLVELRAILGDDVELSVVRESPEMPEPELGDFFEILCDILRDKDPTAVPIPYLVSGGTDARHFARLGIRTYGFLPHRFPPGTSYEKHMHDADERVTVDALEFGTAAVVEALRRYRG